MTQQQHTEQQQQTEEDEQRRAEHANVALRSMGLPNSVVAQFDFWDDTYEGRRLFSEVLGTFFLVLVAVGGGMVNARFGGQAVPYTARVVAPALMVAAIILFMGAVSGAHLTRRSASRSRCAATSPGNACPPTSSPSSSARSSPRWCCGR